MKTLLLALVAVSCVAVLEARRYKHVAEPGLRHWAGSEAASRSRRGLPRRRDPVAERAQANYQKVVQQLNDKFRNLIEGCYPRPKGCLCVVGKDKNGREITERRKKQADCETTDPNLLDSTRGVHDDRDRGGKRAPDYGQRGRSSGRRRRSHHRGN